MRKPHSMRLRLFVQGQDAWIVRNLVSQVGFEQVCPLVTTKAITFLGFANYVPQRSVLDLLLGRRFQVVKSERNPLLQLRRKLENVLLGSPLLITLHAVQSSKDGCTCPQTTSCHKEAELTMIHAAAALRIAFLTPLLSQVCSASVLFAFARTTRDIFKATQNAWVATAQVRAPVNVWLLSGGDAEIAHQRPIKLMGCLNVDKNLVLLQSSVEWTWHERLICHQWAMKVLLPGVVDLFEATQPQQFVSTLPQSFQLLFNEFAESFLANTLWSAHGFSVFRLGARKNYMIQPTWFGFISCSLFRSCWHVLDRWTRRRRAKWRFWRLCVARGFCCNWARWAYRHCRITCWFFNCTGWRWRHSHITRWFCHWLAWNVCRWCFAHAVVMTPKSTCLFFLLSICSHQHERWQGGMLPKNKHCILSSSTWSCGTSNWKLQRVRISKTLVFTLQKIRWQTTLPTLLPRLRFPKCNSQSFKIVLVPNCLLATVASAKVFPLNNMQ